MYNLNIAQVLSQLSSLLTKLPLPCPACLVMYSDGFIEYTYNILYNIFSSMKLKYLFFSPKQGMAIGLHKAFCVSPSDGVHSELHTFPLTLTAVLRGWVSKYVKL